MIQNLFSTVIELSIMASIIALVVYVIRLSIGRYLPKRFSYYLWLIVLFRLIIPIKFTSSLSLLNFVPNTTTMLSRVNSMKISNVQGDAVTDILGDMDLLQTDIISPITQTSPLQTIILIASIVWALGVIFFIMQNIYRYYRIKSILDTSLIIKDLDLNSINNRLKLSRDIKIYTLDLLESPLVYGLIKPKVIIPKSMLDNIQRRDNMQILTHEMIHIKRFDNILKLIWSLGICIHWFNPMVWLSAKYFNEDMELSCDEKVMEIWEDDIRKDYAASLISIAENKSNVLQGNLIGFAKSNIKARVKNIMNYKKPGIWVTVLGILFLAVITIFTLTNPADVQYPESLKLAYEGKMDGVEFAIGDPVHESFEELAFMTYLSGNLVISYDETIERILYTDGYFDDNMNEVLGNVVMISKRDAYGIKSDMTVDEVKKILGKPDYIIDLSEEDDKSEIFGGNTLAHYTVGDYQLIIEYERWGQLVNRIYLRGLKD